MKIIVVTGSYYPNYSAVGVCAKNIVDVLVKKGHDVWVLCNKTTIVDSPLTLDGAKIRYYTTREIEKRLVWKGWRLTLLRVFYFCKIVLSQYSLKNETITAIEKGLNEIVLNELNGKSPDTLVGMVFPFESVIGSLTWIRKTGSPSNVIPIIFDNFVDNPNIHRLSINRKIKYKRHLRLMRDTIAQCLRVIVMHNQKEFYIRNNLFDTTKVFFAEHPLLIPPKFISNERINNSEYLTMLYSGALLKNYVVGKDLCQMVSEIIKNNPHVHAEFCVMGNDTQCVAELESHYPDNIKNNGRVPIDVALTKIEQADILLCVAEKKGKQISSKIFTYMSYGKPIILIYYSDNDVNNVILQKYPLYMSVKASEIHKKLPHIILFIQKNRKSTLSFDEVASIYPEALPETVSNILLEAK